MSNVTTVTRRVTRSNIAVKKKKKKKKSDQRKTGNSGNSNKNVTGFVADYLCLADSSGYNSGNDWLVNSGASRHMTFHFDWFQNFRPTSGDFVCLGDNTTY